MAAKKKPASRVKDGKAYEAVRKGSRAASYDDWTVEDLRLRAKQLGLSGYSGKKKSELVCLLRSH